MAGGIGSRFWPFSRKDRPKQFLDFFGTGRSLLQLTYDRFRKIIPAENILIVSNELYRDLILEQLPEINDNQLLLEPVRRNTAPCIAYAIYKIKSITENANIIVSPSDHLILKESEFLETIRQGLEFVSKNDNLLTLGIKPSRPETGYGYIQIEFGESNLRKVKTFTEKPNAELAKLFFESGEFFWNSGIFLWNLKTILAAFDFHLSEISQKFKQGLKYFNSTEEKKYIADIFHTCPNISIDYGILEKASNVFVLCSDFGWSDLGTWGSLYDISPKDEKENVTLKCKTLYYDSHRNIVALPSGKLAVIQQLNDYIVADSDNVLLICKREDEQQIRQFVKDASILYDGEFD
jgi:mannose-1-phosphate guanylyltransferase